MGTAYPHMGDERDITVTDFVASLDGADGDRLAYSVNKNGMIEIIWDNTIHEFSAPEFDEIKKLMPANWQEYPHDWDSDEVDEIINALAENSMLSELQDDHDYDGALKTLKIHLGQSDIAPHWVKNLDEADIDKLARGVLLVLGIRPDPSPDSAVDRLLDEE